MRSDGGGTVRCWGLNDAGVLGYGDATTRGSGALLQDVPLPGRVSLVVAGHAHTCVVIQRQAYCWGAETLSLGQPAFFGINASGDAPNEVSALR